MKNIELDKINKDLIAYTKSEFLKNEINQAFFVWNQNEYFSKDFSEVSPENPNYFLFLDWLIYDYALITNKKCLVQMYWEENKERIDSTVLNSYRSIFKYEKLSDNKYLIQDIIQNTEHKIDILSEIPGDSVLLSIRILPSASSFSHMSHIIAYNSSYKDIVYNSITNVIKKNKKSPEIICKNFFYVIEKEINKSISKYKTYNSLSEYNERINYEVDDYVGLIKKIKQDSCFELLIKESENIEVYKYYNKTSNEYGNIQLSKNNIVFNNFNESTLTNIIKLFEPYIGNKNLNHLSEEWLNTKLSMFGNKTPLEAIKYKKYLKKMKGALIDLELLYESRTSDNEPCIDPIYVTKRLGLQEN